MIRSKDGLTNKKRVIEETQVGQYGLFGSSWCVHASQLLIDVMLTVENNSAPQLEFPNVASKAIMAPKVEKLKEEAWA